MTRLATLKLSVALFITTAIFALMPIVSYACGGGHGSC